MGPTLIYECPCLSPNIISATEKVITLSETAEEKSIVYCHVFQGHFQKIHLLHYSLPALCRQFLSLETSAEEKI